MTHAPQPTRQPTSSLAVFRLVYRSHSRIPEASRRASLAEIFSTARSRNKEVGITGALLLTDHYFVQALEGDEAAVRDLYERISEDHRHDQVSILDTQAVGDRVFSRWAMAEVSKAGGADIPLINDVDRGGITTAAAPRLTRGQSQVLRQMRNAIGADTV